MSARKFRYAPRFISLPYKGSCERPARLQRHDLNQRLEKRLRRFHFTMGHPGPMRGDRFVKKGTHRSYQHGHVPNWNIADHKRWSGLCENHSINSVLDGGEKDAHSYAAFWQPLVQRVAPASPHRAFLRPAVRKFISDPQKHANPGETRSRLPNRKSRVLNPTAHPCRKDFCFLQSARRDESARWAFGAATSTNLRAWRRNSM